MFTPVRSPARGFLAGLLGLFAVHASAVAQTLTETVSFGPATPTFSPVLTFASYGGDLSTLASVEVAWNLVINGGSLVIDNDGAGPASGSWSFGAHILLDAGNTDVTLLDGSFAPIFTGTEVTNAGLFNLAGNVGDGAGDYDSSGPDGALFAGVSRNGSGGAYVNGLFLAQFVSGGGGSAGSTLDIALDVAPFLDLISSGGTEYSANPVTASGSVTLSYHVIPEPGLAGLLSLAALLALRRRRS